MLQICDSTGMMGNGGPRVQCTLPKRDLYVNNRGLVYPSFVAPPPLTESEALEVEHFNQQAGTCGEDEKSHKALGPGGKVLEDMAAHMAYNKDGYYVTAASCYITKMFKAAASAAI
jgi:hypothetical protein